MDNRCRTHDLKLSGCDDELFTLLEDLLKAHKTCATNAKGDVTSCRSESILDFMLKNEGQFDKILNKAPSTSWLLFPQGKPGTGVWPSPSLEGKYLANLGHSREAFREASYILVLSHATKDKSRQNNILLQKRLELAYRLLQNLDSDPTWKSEIQGKLRGFAIPPDQPILLNNLQPSQEGSELPPVNIVAGEDNDQIRYGKMLEGLRRGDQLEKQDYDDLENALNRSVTIVPIFCKLPDVDL